MANSDDKDLKTKLIQEIKRNPDPDEAGLESFLKVIRDHEAVVNAREFKEDSGGNTLNRVKTQGELTGPQHPHKVCGKIHGRGECKYQCRECKKPHREEDCYVLHLEKRPKSWATPPKKKEKGRGRERERSKGTDRERSKTRSGDRRVEKPKDRRQQSPYQPRKGLIESQKRTDVMRVKTIQNRKKKKMKKSWKDFLQSRRNYKRNLTRGKDLLQREELDQIFLVKAERKVSSWNCSENGQEEKTREIQEPLEKVETIQDP